METPEMEVLREGVVGGEELLSRDIAVWRPVRVSRMPANIAVLSVRRGSRSDKKGMVEKSHRKELPGGRRGEVGKEGQSCGSAALAPSITSSSK